MVATISSGALSVETAALDVVVADLYRDIHKGIRNELFAVTNLAGRVDPADTEALGAAYDRFHELVGLLVDHAGHEDTFVQPLIEKHAPVLGVVVAESHPRLEANLAALEVLAERVLGAATADRRLLAHRFYLGVASFTAAYLEHEEFEELEVMPALSKAMTPDELRAIHGAIVANIPPEAMAYSLPKMLWAMHVDERADMLGGMRMMAPPPVFAGVCEMARSVLDPADYRVLAARLGID
jgi:hypothetical protein